MKRFLTLPAALVLLGPACASASDLNPLGLYLGASGGQVSDTYSSFGTDQRHDTGWKAMVGLRPLPFLGAELEYIDYGSASFSTPITPVSPGELSGSAHATAESLFALGYLPIPLSPVDLFAKLGVEHVHTSAEGGASGATSCGLECESVFVHTSESDLAYGAGVQVRAQAVAIRAEYERTQTTFGHPSLLSLGVTWTF